MQKYTVEIDNDKTIRWYIFNTKIIHREDGPAIEHYSGSKFWYQNNQQHRLGGGPALEFIDGDKYWMQNGKLHRLDGPAVEYDNGNKEWYIEGVKYTKEVFLKKTTKQASCDGKVFTDEDGKKYKLVAI